jgi:Rieske 2Fe-2S family protein
MATYVRPSVRGGATTLPSRYYVSDEVFALERERVFARSWVCVGRQEQLAQPGDFFLAEVAGESLIVVRDRTDAIRAHFNVCRHRGTRICDQPQGHFAGSIQCPYHAWTYGLSGELQTARNMELVPDFDRADYPLIAAAVRIEAGFIFVALEPPPAALPPLAQLRGKLAAWGVETLRVGASARYELACNWKLVFQNYSECYHCPLIHPQLTKLSPPDSGRNDFSEGPVLGGYMTLRHAGSSMTTSGNSLTPLGTVSGDELLRVYYYTIFPTMLLSLHPDYVMTHRIRALGPARCEVLCDWLFAASAVDSPDFDPSDAFNFWDVTNRQDWHVSELSQRGIGSRAYRQGPYAEAEGLLAAFDRHYLATLEG